MAKSRSGRLSLFGRVYSPINHLLSATRKVGRSAASRSGSILNSGLGFVQNTGKTVTSEVNAGLNNLIRGTRKSRKGRKGRKNRKSRKSRK